MKNKVRYSLYSLAINVIVVILSVVGVISLWQISLYYFAS